MSKNPHEKDIHMLHKSAPIRAAKSSAKVGHEEGKDNFWCAVGLQSPSDSTRFEIASWKLDVTDQIGIQIGDVS